MNTAVDNASAARTFDIRFARVTGIAGVLAARGNFFGWRGAGQLDIDDDGVTIAVNGSLASLFVRRRSHRIAAGRIQEVYREGECLRLEFLLGDNTRVTMPFWARDRAAAARIVQLLPTLRTVEVEDDLGNRSDSSVGWSRWPALVLFFAVVGTATFILVRRTTHAVQTARNQEPTEQPLPARRQESTPETAAQGAPATGGATVAPSVTAAETYVAPANPAEASSGTSVERPAQYESNDPASTRSGDVTRPAASSSSRQPAPAKTDEADVEGFVPSVPSILVRPEDVVVPIRQGTVAYDVARGILSQFESGAAELNEDFRQKREQSDSGRLGASDFATALNLLADKWRNMSVRLLDTPDARDPALTGFRATLLASASYEISFLPAYADAVRRKDADAASRALQDQAQAAQALERARLYLH